MEWIRRLSGTIRPEDICKQYYSSSNIADAKLHTNAGVYADSTQPGWLSKILGK